MSKQYPLKPYDGIVGIQPSPLQLHHLVLRWPLGTLTTHGRSVVREYPPSLQSRSASQGGMYHGKIFGTVILDRLTRLLQYFSLIFRRIPALCIHSRKPSAMFSRGMCSTM